MNGDDIENVKPKSSDLRRYLIHIVRNEGGRLVTYKEVGQAIGHPHRSLKSYLDEVAEDCYRLHEPDLTALIVRADTRVPGQFRWRAVNVDTIDRAGWEAVVDEVRLHPGDDQGSS